MRKKVLGIIAVTLTASMMAATLTGCGTAAKATDQEVVMEEEPIIVTDEEDSEEVTIETEDEITGTEEVIADDGEADTEASYTEHEYFFALDETDISTAQEVDLSALVPVQEMHELKESVTLYGSGRGMIIGYTKPDITVELMSISDKWYCINFADEDPAYQLVLVKAEDFIASSGMEVKEEVVVTADDVLNAFMQVVSNIKTEEYEILDSLSADMEYIDFSIPKNWENVKDWVEQTYIINNMSNYSTYYLELQDTDYGDGYLNFRLYYANPN